MYRRGKMQDGPQNTQKGAEKIHFSRKEEKKKPSFEGFSLKYGIC